MSGLDGFDDLGPGGSGDNGLTLLDIQVEAVEPGLVVQPAGGVIALGVGLRTVGCDLGDGPNEAFMIGVGDGEAA